MSILRQAIIAASFSGLLAGCNNDPAQYAGSPVRTASAGEVAQCKFISNFSNTPGDYGLFAAKAQDYARNAILRDAGANGANTVVFEKVDPGSMVTIIRAAAYRC